MRRYVLFILLFCITFPVVAQDDASVCSDEVLNSFTTLFHQQLDQVNSVTDLTALRAQVALAEAACSGMAFQVKAQRYAIPSLSIEK